MDHVKRKFFNWKMKRETLFINNKRQFRTFLLTGILNCLIWPTSMPGNNPGLVFRQHVELRTFDISYNTEDYIHHSDHMGGVRWMMNGEGLRMAYFYVWIVNQTQSNFRIVLGNEEIIVIHDVLFWHNVPAPMLGLVVGLH